MRKRFLVISIVMLLLIMLATPVFAQGSGETKNTAFPTKQVTLIVQAGAGGSSDTNCRTIAPGVEKALGVPVVVENRPGGGGGIAISYGAAQKPDGYVINHLPIDIVMLKPMGNADVTPSDFDFLCRVAYHGAAVAVRADSPYQTFQEFLADAKANPGKINLGNSGIGAIWHLAAVQLENATGAKFTHIPFEGAAPSVTALLGGHVDAVVCSPAEVSSQVKGGDLRLLTIFYDERMPMFPDVPTLKEQGIDLSSLVWLAFGVPAGTPADVRESLTNAFKESYNSEKYQEMLKNYGMEPGWMNAAECTEFVNAEYKKYSKLIPEVMGR